MRILLTGYNGYIGSMMGPALRAAGHDVVGLDIGYFDECTLIEDQETSSFIRKDIRSLTAPDLQGFDAVVHLAALSNDPIGNLRSRWTQDINLHATIRLAELARDAGVDRFLFASSCIMYGAATDVDVTEDSPLAPQTEYARSKVAAEMALTKLATKRFSPIRIRNGTVYGLSPRMRFDTVFNNLVGQAVTTGQVVVFSNGRPWRPVVHVKDICRSFVQYVEAPKEAIHNQVFNNGAARLNYRIKELAEIAVDAVPNTKLEIRSDADADQRTYKTDFGKFARTFPNFEFEWTAEKGARELLQALKRCNVTIDTFKSPKFTRLKHLSALLSGGRLDDNLQWTRPLQASAAGGGAE
jgi:nucleoside-diphosphate-sugar epimerase